VTATGTETGTPTNTGTPTSTGTPTATPTPPSSFAGSAVITADRPVTIVSRPEIGDQVMAYDGFSTGSTTMYVPMLFHDASGNNAAMWVQNLDAANTTDITIRYFDTKGNPTCTHTDSIPPLTSHGYWMQFECVPAGWSGSAVVTANHNIAAVGRPHLGTEIFSYDGIAAGSTTTFAPMLFRSMWTVYDSGLFIQNVDPANSTDFTIHYYDSTGALSCTHSDTLAPMASRYYSILSECVPNDWVGAAVITASHNIVTLGRGTIDGREAVYDGFTSGSLTGYVPMMYSSANGGTQESALYVQDLDPSSSAAVTMKFYDRTGSLTCTQTDTIPPNTSHHYWLATQSCAPVGWTGGVVITSDHDIAAVGRPHFGNEIFGYSGFTSGVVADNLPMVFAKAFGGSYNSSIYLQNLDPANTAHFTIRFYDLNGTLTITTTGTLVPFAAEDLSVPSLLGP
jgi:hypothetical protein